MKFSIRGTAKLIIGWQLLTLLLVLMLPVFVFSATPIKMANSQEVVRFALYNYDNLIADSYESNSAYLQELAFLLSKQTPVSAAQYFALLKSPELIIEPDPVKYMLAINQKTKTLTGYYFVDN